MQGVLVDMLNVLNLIATAAGAVAGSAAGQQAGTTAGAAAGGAAGTAAAQAYTTSQIQALAVQAATSLVVGPAAANYLAAPPKVLPAQSGQLWWDGGVLAMS